MELKDGFDGAPNLTVTEGAGYFRIHYMELKEYSGLGAPPAMFTVGIHYMELKGVDMGFRGSMYLFLNGESITWS